MSKEEESLAKIREMAKLSLLSNRISSFQEKNLKAFPLVFFNGIFSATLDYDFSNPSLVDFESDSEKIDIKYKFNKIDTTHFNVTYRLIIDKSIPNDSIEKRFEALEGAVRGLFWKDTTVKVFINDILMYESTK